MSLRSLCSFVAKNSAIRPPQYRCRPSRRLPQWRMILNGFKRWLGDASWAEGKRSSAWLVGMTTFGILVLELALIRWTSGQVRVFAYVNNIVLITAFLGMGLGVVDIKSTVVESADQIARAIERAEKVIGAGRVKYIHPDCGFWMLKRNMADGKIRALVAGRDLYEGRG